MASIPYVAPGTYTYYHGDGTGASVSLSIEFPPSDDMWNTFFGEDYLDIDLETYQKDSSYYETFFSKYYSDFFIQETSEGKTPAEIKADTTGWETFLNSSDCIRRTKNPFLWAYSLLLELLPRIQKFAGDEGQRNQALTNAQDAAVSALAAIYLIDINSTSEFEFMYQNKIREANMQKINAWKGVVAGFGSKTDKYTSSASDAVSEAGSMMSALLQEMRDIINRLIQ